MATQVTLSVNGEVTITIGKEAEEADFSITRCGQTTRVTFGGASRFQCDHGPQTSTAEKEHREEKGRDREPCARPTVQDDDSHGLGAGHATGRFEQQRRQELDGTTGDTGSTDSVFVGTAAQPNVSHAADTVVIGQQFNLQAKLSKDFGTSPQTEAWDFATHAAPQSSPIQATLSDKVPDSQPPASSTFQATLAKDIEAWDTAASQQHSSRSPRGTEARETTQSSPVQATLAEDTTDAFQAKLSEDFGNSPETEAWDFANLAAQQSAPVQATLSDKVPDSQPLQSSTSQATLAKDFQATLSAPQSPPVQATLAEEVPDKQPLQSSTSQATLSEDFQATLSAPHPPPVQAMLATKVPDSQPLSSSFQATLSSNRLMGKGNGSSREQKRTVQTATGTSCNPHGPPAGESIFEHTSQCQLAGPNSSQTEFFHIGDDDDFSQSECGSIMVGDPPAVAQAESSDFTSKFFATWGETDEGEYKHGRSRPWPIIPIPPSVTLHQDRLVKDTLAEGPRHARPPDPFAFCENTISCPKAIGLCVPPDDPGLCGVCDGNLAAKPHLSPFAGHVEADLYTMSLKKLVIIAQLRAHPLERCQVEDNPAAASVVYDEAFVFGEALFNRSEEGSQEELKLLENLLDRFIAIEEDLRCRICDATTAQTKVKMQKKPKRNKSRK